MLALMSIDHHYLRDERLLIRIAIVLGVIAGMLTFILAKNLSDHSRKLSSEDVWQFIREVAPQRGIDPEFVYAIAWAESSLDPKARSSVARGIMQLTETAWREVTEESYRHAWDWKTNIRVGIDYMDFCRQFLKQHDAFSYPLLAASYRYGPYYVKNRGFDLRQVKPPKNNIYQRIFAGNIRPVAPPE